MLLVLSVSHASPQAGSAPIPTDERSQATTLMADGMKLLVQHTPDSLQSAILDYQQAFQLWKKLGDQEKQIEAILAESSGQFFLHRKDEALALLAQARQLAEASGNRGNEAMVLSNAVLLYDGMGEERKALEESARLLTILQALGDKADQGPVYSMQGSIYRKLNDTPNAFANYDQAASLLRDSGNKRGEAEALQGMAQLNALLNRREGFEKAVTYYTQVIPLFQSLQDKFNEAYSWWGLGTANDRLDRRQQARDAYLRALPFFVEKKDGNSLGRIFLSLGEDEEALGNLQKANEYYVQAEPFLTSPGEALGRGLVLMKLGKAEKRQGDLTKAIDDYRAAIILWHSAGDKSSEAAAYLAIDEACFATRNWVCALDASSQALKLYQGLRDRSGQAAALTGTAEVYFTHGDYKKSLELALQSIDLLDGDPMVVRMSAALQSAGQSYGALHENKKALDYLGRSIALSADNPIGKAGALAAMGEVYSAMGDQKRALESVEQSLAILRPLNDPAGTNKVLNDLGLTYSAMGKKTQALDTFEKTLADARYRKDIQQQSATLDNLAQMHQGFGDTRQAKELYLESLVLIRRVGDRYQEAGTLANLGMAYHSLGQEQTAEESLEASLAIHRELSDSHGAAVALNNLALFYSETGELQKALEYYEQSLKVFKDLDDLPEQGTAYNNLGSVYRILGLYDRSQIYYTDALQIREQTNDDDGRMVTLNNLAVISQIRGELGSAKEYYQRALDIAGRLQNRTSQARLLSGMAMVESDMGNQRRAIDELQHSLSISQTTDDLDSEALALHNLGAVYEKLDELPEALARLRQALPLWQQIHGVDGESATLTVISRVEYRQGDLKSALAHVDQAIQLSESQRSRLGSEDLRASFLATTETSYELKIAILMRLDRLHPGRGYASRGLETSEQSRARSLVDLLAESRINVRQGVDAQLLAREQSIVRAMNTKALQLRKLTFSAQDSADRLILTREIEDLTAALEAAQAGIRVSSPAYAALTQPKPVTVQKIQQELDADTLLLEYSLGKQHSYLWAVTPSSVDAYELPAREMIVDAAREFRDTIPQLANPDGMELAATKAGAVLLGPVAAELHKKRLVIVCDGLLQALVPFAALEVPSQTSGKTTEGTTSALIEDHEVIMEASMSALVALRHETAGRKLPSKAVTVLADPVFEQSDERIAQLPSLPATVPPHAAEPSLLSSALQSSLRGGETLSRLPKTRDEADDILKLTSPDDSMIKLDFDASKINAENPELANYRIVHFATHGILDQTHPDLSGIVFSLYDKQGQSIDGFLRLNEIFNLKLPVQLVVLSACQSGQGKIVGGEGLVGLTRGFMYAGAETMVASLWKVDDAATAELMKRFYAKMLSHEQLRPAAALRAAQLEMVNETKWKAPYFWASFVVQGEWR